MANHLNCCCNTTPFWWKKIPELMKGLGGGIKEFKKASKEEEEDSKDN